MKSVKRMLAERKSEILPDEKVKDRIKTELFTDTESRYAAADGGETAAVRRHPRYIAYIACALIAVLAVCIAVPLALRGGTGGTGGGLSFWDKFSSINTAEDFYAYGAASVGTLLSTSVASDAAASTASDKTVRPAARKRTDALGEQQIIDAVNGYMTLVESLLSDGSISHDSADIPEAYADYEYAMTVRYRDMLGRTVAYEMYYDRILTDSEYEDGESEEEYAIRGVLVVDGVPYPVEGEQETETEDGETESEMQFTAYISSDRRSYISVEQEYESDERQYVYTVCENGRRETTEVEYESERGEHELKLTVDKAVGGRDEVYFRPANVGGAAIAATAYLDGIRADFTVYVEESSYRYEFSDGSFSAADRHGGDSEDDDDDDD